MKVKKIPHKEWIKIYSKVPRICVDLIIKSKEGIILTRRNIYPYKGYWHTPGGGIIFGEKVEEAVKRVAKKELNLKVKLLKVDGYMDFPVIKNYGHAVSFACICEPVGNKIAHSDEAEEVKYFKIAPKKIIKEQKEFLIKHKYLKDGK